MARRTLVRPPSRKDAALPQEQAITETMLAPIAVWRATPPNRARIGTMKMPLAMPSIPPSALAPSDMPNSHNAKPASMSGISGLHRGPRASGKARHEPDQITTIVQPLVIDWPIAGGVGRALDQEDGAAGRHLERLGGHRVGRGRFQLVFSFDQRRIILLLQQCEDRLGFKVVIRNLLPYVTR